MMPLCSSRFFLLPIWQHAPPILNVFIATTALNFFFFYFTLSVASYGDSIDVYRVCESMQGMGANAKCIGGSLVSKHSSTTCLMAATSATHTRSSYLFRPIEPFPNRCMCLAVLHVICTSSFVHAKRSIEDVVKPYMYMLITWLLHASVPEILQGHCTTSCCLVQNSPPSGKIPRLVSLLLQP